MNFEGSRGGRRSGHPSPQRNHQQTWKGREVGRFGKEYITNSLSVLYKKKEKKKGPNNVFMILGTISKHKSISLSCCSQSSSRPFSAQGETSCWPVLIRCTAKWLASTLIDSPMTVAARKWGEGGWWWVRLVEWSYTSGRSRPSAGLSSGRDTGAEAGLDFMHLP